MKYTEKNSEENDMKVDRSDGTLESRGEQINDGRLTPRMKSIRAGLVQIFYFHGEKWMDTAIFVKPPKQELCAKLIDGKWFWVNRLNEDRLQNEKQSGRH